MTASFLVALYIGKVLICVKGWWYFLSNYYPNADYPSWIIYVLGAIPAIDVLGFVSGIIAYFIKRGESFEMCC